MSRSSKLTARELRFVEAYMVNLNASEASRASGYTGPRANMAGNRMLGRPAVAAEIARRRAAQSKAADVEGKDVLRALSRIAFFDVRKLFEVDGTPKRITDLDDATAAAVVGVDVVTVGNREVGYGKVMRVKLADKVRALELLGRHLGLFAEMSFEVKGGVHVYIPANGRDQTAGKGA